MMDRTDRHCRFFHRVLSRRARLYTEMITAAAIVRGDHTRLLDRGLATGPVALQLGGNDPQELMRAAVRGQAAGFDEINLNAGCPSDRVQSGRFGACLFLEPERVARAVRAMQDVVDVPVTVKTRIGVDDQPVGPPLWRFVETVAEAGCRVFIIHARKAWLTGLSPRENREIPPLSHAAVWDVKRRFPELTIVLNGGIRDLNEAGRHLQEVDGVMLGRAAYHDPWMLARVDPVLFGDAPPVQTREEAVHVFARYVEQQLRCGVALPAMTRHLLGLFHGVPGARAWRRRLVGYAARRGADNGTLLQALAGTAPEAARAA